MKRQHTRSPLTALTCRRLVFVSRRCCVPCSAKILVFFQAASRSQLRPYANSKLSRLKLESVEDRSPRVDGVQLDWSLVFFQGSSKWLGSFFLNVCSNASIVMTDNTIYMHAVLASLCLFERAYIIWSVFQTLLSKIYR